MKHPFFFGTPSRGTATVWAGGLWLEFRRKHWVRDPVAGGSPLLPKDLGWGWVYTVVVVVLNRLWYGLMALMVPCFNQPPNTKRDFEWWGLPEWWAFIGMIGWAHPCESGLPYSWNCERCGHMCRDNIECLETYRIPNPTIAWWSGMLQTCWESKLTSRHRHMIRWWTIQLVVEIHWLIGGRTSRTSTRSIVNWWIKPPQPGGPQKIGEFGVIHQSLHRSKSDVT